MAAIKERSSQLILVAVYSQRGGGKESIPMKDVKNEPGSPGKESWMEVGQMFLSNTLSEVVMNP